jgi:hypothetical protein
MSPGRSPAFDEAPAEPAGAPRTEAVACASALTETGLACASPLEPPGPSGSLAKEKGCCTSDAEASNPRERAAEGFVNSPFPRTLDAPRDEVREGAASSINENASESQADLGIKSLVNKPEKAALDLGTNSCSRSAANGSEAAICARLDPTADEPTV